MPRRKTTPVKENNEKAAKKGKKAKYFAFRMVTGNEEYIEDAEEAREFLRENESIVVKQFDFTAKQAFKKHIADYEKTKKSVGTPEKRNPSVSAEEEKLSPLDQEKIKKINLMIEQSRPCNRIEVYWRTTSRSKVFALLLRFVNQYGHDQWYVKAEQISIALKNYVSFFKQENPTIQAAIERMDVGFMRDPKGDAHAIESTKWKSPNDQQERTFEQYVTFTYVDIPVEDFDNDSSETVYIEEVAEAFGETIKHIMVTKTFLPCLQKAVNRQQMWEKMTIKNKGLTFVEFIADCKIRVMCCENINTHLILRDANKVTTLLYEHRVEQRKYPVEKDEGNEDEEESEEENEQEQENEENQDPDESGEDTKDAESDKE